MRALDAALHEADASHCEAWGAPERRGGGEGEQGMTPPPVARRLLYALLPTLDRDVIVADLDEEFRREIAPRRTRLAARLWYWRQVMTSLPDAARLRARFPWSDFVRDTSHGLRLLARNPRSQSPPC